MKKSNPKTTGNNLIKKSLISSPLKILYLLVPIAAILLTGLATVGTSDVMNILAWFLIYMIFGLAAFPISARIFENSLSAGFLMSQPIGLLTVALVQWTLSYIGILPFTQLTVAILIVLLAAASYSIKPLRTNLIKKLSREGTIENIAFEQTVFAVALTALCYIKGFLPDINGQEKFMDYGFIMSMLRSSSLPAGDMWLSGYSINYYYFGQYIYALVIKLSGIAPSVGYNIAMCTSIALPFGMCYFIGSMLINTAKNFGMRCVRFAPHICGLICGFAAMIWGNSHSFFYDENSVGNKLLLFFSKLGINVGRTDAYYYPDSTRYIGYNPDSSLIEGIRNGADYTIEEFPFYSFLIGDLHAHVVSTMVVLLIMAVAIALVGKAAAAPVSGLSDKKTTSVSNFSSGAIIKELTGIISAELIIITILLGIAQMTNYWDFLIYFIFCSMALLIINTRHSASFATVPGSFLFCLVLGGILLCYMTAGSRPWIHLILQLCVLGYTLLFATFAPCALTRTTLGMSIMFTGSHIIALPFNSEFDMISNSIALAVNHSSPFQLFILYGTHLIICLGLVLTVILTRNYVVGNKRKITIYGEPSVGWTNPVARFFGQRNPIDVFVCGMVAVSILLIIIPEIIYVRDIYTSGYLRANTMFKFSYAAFIILSVCISYAIARLPWFRDKNGKFMLSPLILSLVFILMLFIPAHYTSVSIEQRCGELTSDRYKGLDGTAYISTYSSRYTGIQESGNLEPYMACINWFNETVEGEHVIIETYGESYTDYNIVSSYTGLQTVCGWQTHEWLWRFHGVVNKETNLLEADPNHDVWQLFLTPRHDDINTVYTSSVPADIQQIIDKYNVEYIIIGSLEKNRFGYDNTAVIGALGEVVFTYEDLNVIRVYPR